MTDETYMTLRSANIARQKAWDTNDAITLAYRGNELAGEAGEACNVIKKIERERLGIRGSRDTVEHLAEELADVVICTDLIAMSEGIDLDAAVAAKFNATSEKVGLPQRLYLAAAPAAEPVAWGVKDFADGWVPYGYEHEARNSAEARDGHLVLPLYLNPLAAAPVEPVALPKDTSRFRNLSTNDDDDVEPVAWCDDEGCPHHGTRHVCNPPWWGAPEHERQRMLSRIAELEARAAIEAMKEPDALLSPNNGAETMTAAILPERLAEITHLDSGAHSDFNAGVCAMEAASYIAGEPWSDHPECVCPIIAAFMRLWNDALPDEKRTELLLPLIPATIGTRGDAALANRRSTMAADWLVRVHTPAWLRLAGLTTHADALASLTEITDFAKTPALMPALEAARKDAHAARDAAWDAAWDAAGAAAGAAARAAARDAARTAAGDAARTAAWDAARDAAWDAAWDAARTAAGAAAGAAAWDAAWDAALPTVTELQASAAELVKRMCALEAA